MPSIDEVLRSRPTTDLATVRAGGDLQHRFDAKYVLTEAAMAAVVRLLDENWKVLAVDGQKATDYRSAYFDDDRFGSFRDHIQGRRLRYKVRTRRYGDNTGEVLELKLKSGRGATDKRRRNRSGRAGVELTDVEWRWLREMLVDAYGFHQLPPLTYTLNLRYTRRTLFNPLTNERVTIDTDLVAATAATSVRPVGAAAVMEVKAQDWIGPTVRLLQRHAVRPVAFSKYCAALSSLHPELDQRTRQRALRSFSQFQR